MQHPIDIAALLPATFPFSGQALPETGVMLAGTPDQSAIFADALRVLLNSTGQATPLSPAPELLATLSQDTSRPSSASCWFMDDTAGAEGEQALAILSGDGGEQNPGDTPDLDLMPVAIALGNAPAGFTLDFAEDQEGESLPGPLRLSATADQVQPNLAANESLATKPTTVEMPLELAVLESENSALAGTLPDNLQTQAFPESLLPEIAGLDARIASGADDQAMLAARIDLSASALPIAEALAPSMAKDGEAGVLTTPPERAHLTSSSTTQTAANPETQSLLSVVSRFSEDTNLKIEITSGDPVTSRLGQLLGTGATESLQPEAQPENSPIEPDVQSAVRLTPKAQQTVPAPASEPVVATEVAKAVPVVSAPVENLDATAVKSRIPVQHPDETESKPAIGRTLDTKAGLPQGGRISNATINTKLAAALPFAGDSPVLSASPCTDNPSKELTDPAADLVRSSENPITRSNRTVSEPVKSDPPPAQTNHTTATANQTQTAVKTEGAESAAPARFEIEIPKPLRVPGQIHVHLDPPELGQVRIDLTSSRGGIIGSLRVQSEQTRSIIEREIGQLQRTLQDAGVRVERLEVLATSPSNSRNNLHTNMNNQQSWSQNPASHNALGQSARGQAGIPGQNTRRQEPALAEAPVRNGAYAAISNGHVNLVA